MADSQPKLGRVPYWDKRNEDHLIEDVAPRIRSLGAAIVKGRGLAANRDRSWRNWWWGDQGQTSQCTSYGTLHLMACAPIIHKGKNPLWNPVDFYRLIQSIDRSEGRDYGFDGGATTLAACKAAMRIGWIGGYEWVSEFESVLGYVHDVGPVIAGTNWYDSMFQRDQYNVCRITPGATVVGGHLYCVNGIYPSLNRVRIAQTWGDGYYYLSISDFRRLFQENGEIALLRELPV